MTMVRPRFASPCTTDTATVPAGVMAGTGPVARTIARPIGRPVSGHPFIGRGRPFIGRPIGRRTGPWGRDRRRGRCLVVDRAERLSREWESAEAARVFPSGGRE